MKRWKMVSRIIESIGYDALCAILEVEYREEVEIRQYLNVPESVWYELKESQSPEHYLISNVIGKYEEISLKK